SRSIFSKGRSQNTHFLLRYHFSSTLRTRHSSDATSSWSRHSCPQSCLIGQRQQFCRRRSVWPTSEVNVACWASTSTIACLPVSGQMITRSPENFCDPRTKYLTPK